MASMFAGVDTSRSYPRPGFVTTADWQAVEVVEVEVASLTMTQPGVYFAPLLRGGSSWSGDPYPHVIEHAGCRYLEDGHHRVMRALLAGERTIQTRLYRTGC